MGKLPETSAGCRASEVLTCARAKFVTGCSTFRCTAFLFSLICTPQVLAGWRFSIFGLTSGVPDGVTGANCREVCNMIPLLSGAALGALRICRCWMFSSAAGAWSLAVFSAGLCGSGFDVCKGRAFRVLLSTFSKRHADGWQSG